MNIIKNVNKTRYIEFSAGDVITINTKEEEIDVFVVEHPHEKESYFLVSLDGKRVWFSQINGKTVEHINQAFLITGHYRNKNITMKMNI